jgi:hypothetical protein
VTLPRMTSLRVVPFNKWNVALCGALTSYDSAVLNL